ncbi:MAG: hypothetical protein AB7N76_26855 [Planctomycetota bacterium]
MKQNKTCPKCGGREIHHAPCVMDRGEGNEAMCLAVRRSDPIHARDLGQFEVYVCTGCGFSEFYVISPEELLDD